MRRKRKNGFTLIEVLVAVAIVAVAGMFMYAFLGQGMNLYAVETASAEQQADMRMVMSEITNKVRVTDKTSITYGLGVLTIGDYAYAFDGERILRNETELAGSISAFAVSITNGILDVSLTNSTGTQISTSLSLVD